MISLSQELLEQYEKFINKHLKTAADIESAKELLLRIRASGNYLNERFGREQAAQFARNLGEELFELTGEYPSVRLVPLNMNTVTPKNSSIPFLVPLQPSFRLVGRKNLLEELKSQLIYPSTYALYGLPGVGKTAIAIELVHDLNFRNHFPDGVLWAGLGNNPDILVHLRLWSQILGIAPSQMAELGIESLIKLLRASIGERKMLLIIDDVWKIEDAQSLVVGGPNCAHLVTTRSPEVAKNVAGEKAIWVHELSDESGLELLAGFAPEIINSEKEEAQKLVDAVGKLPLALVLMGKYIQTQPQNEHSLYVQKALNHLNEARKRMELSQPQTSSLRITSLPLSTPVSLQLSIHVSVEQLDAQAQQLLFSLTIFRPKPNNFSEDAILEICQISKSALNIIVNSGLLERGIDGYYTLHQTIADYGKLKLGSGKIALLQKRMFGFFIRFVEQHEADQIALAREEENISAALEIRPEQRMISELTKGNLPWATFLERIGKFDQVKKLLNQIQQETQNNDRLLVSILVRLGTIEGKQGNYKQSEQYLQEGLRIAEDISDQKNSIQLLQILGSITFKQDNYLQAKEYVQKGLTLARKLDDQEQISILSGRLGSITRKFGDYTEAEALLQEGLGLARKIGNIEKISSLLTNLGAVKVELGDYSSAREYWLEGLSLARGVGANQSICMLLSNLGIAENSLGNHRQAERYLQEGLSVAYQIGDKEGRCFLLTNLGKMKSLREQYEEAEKLYLEGLHLAESLNDIDMQCYLLGELGKVKTFQQDFFQAESYLTKGMQLADKLADGRLISILHIHWGDFHLMREEDDHALKCFDDALKAAQKLDLQEQIGESMYGLSQVNASQGKYLEARHLGEECLKVFTAIGYYKMYKVQDWLSKISAKA